MGVGLHQIPDSVEWRERERREAGVRRIEATPMSDELDEFSEDMMSRAPETIIAEGSPAAAPQRSVGKVVCPYCGSVNEKSTGPCPRCTMEDTPATRASTKARIGPWYVLQSRNPSAPGMKWSTMLSLVSRGQVAPRSIVRGPTTHQLWRFAGHVKGLSREMGICYACGLEIEKTANQCPHCDRLQEPPINPDALLETREPAPRPTVQREIRSADASEALTASQLAVREDELPRDWKPDAGILSARELAAAFQLDFNPAASSPQKISAPSEPRSAGKTFLLLVLLVAAGVAALMYFKPEYRHNAVAFGNEMVGWVHTKWNSLNAPEKPNPLKEIQSPERIETAVNPARSETPVPVKPFEGPVQANLQSPPVEVVSQPQQPIPVSPADVAEMSSELWKQALDAEGQKDYPKAIDLYEKIKQLPPNVWPSNLDIYLQQAREQLKK